MQRIGEMIVRTHTYVYMNIKYFLFSAGANKKEKDI